MTSCTSCGHESASTARFCAECGLPLISPKAVGAEILTGTDKSHWLTSATDAGDSAVRVPGVRRGVKHPLPLVAAVLVLAFVIWNLFRAPTTAVEGLAGNLDAVMPSASIPSDAGSDDTVGGEDQADDESSTSTTADPDSTVVDVSGLDPALARYHLLAQHSGRLLRVDLDTGELESHEVDGRLLGEFGSRLYFVDSGTIFSLPIDDLDTDPVPEGTSVEDGHDIIAASLTGDGLIHLTTAASSSELDLTMIRIDLSTGSEQRAKMHQYGTFGLVEVAGAGLFELSGDGFRQLADGSARFYGERLIVVEECEEPGSCRRYWLDRQTGEEIARPVPDGTSGWLLGAGGRIAVTYAGRARIFIDTESGETLPDLVGGGTQSGFPIPDDLTPDERYLAAVPANDSGNVRIHDLTSGQSWTLDLPRTFNLTKVLFVPKAEPVPSTGGG